MLLQHLLEIPTRVTSGMLGNLLWGAHHHDLEAQNEEGRSNRKRKEMYLCLGPKTRDVQEETSVSYLSGHTKQYPQSYNPKMD
jgi:hypothetical protein